MTRLAGPIRQLGFVVRDADVAMKYWAEVVGVGPFLVFRKMSFEDYRYRGKVTDSPVVTIGLAHSGPLQVEIIQQHDDAPSAYRDFLLAERGEFQHVSPWFPDAASYDAAYNRLHASGLEVVHQGVITGGFRFAYFCAPGGGWPQLEISEALKPGAAEMWSSLQAAARGWDGTAPLRERLDDL
jgi:hypothetical protein